jgi:nucleoside-diphosphate-sugar epimerase
MVKLTVVLFCNCCSASLRSYVTGNVAHAALLAQRKLRPGSALRGQAYFITNGHPLPFWRFISAVLVKAGAVKPTKTISFWVAYFFAYVLEKCKWLLGRFAWFRPIVSRYMICKMSCHHFFSHAKATRDLGYKPIFSLEAGLSRTFKHLSLTYNNELRVRHRIELNSSTGYGFDR